MSKEAMKLALKDLKWVDDWLCEKPMPDCVARLRKAIKNLEEALNHCEDNLDMVKQEQGEPVAIIHRNEYNEYRLEPHDSFDIKSIPFNVDVSLFKSPQQRTWVGLTDDEVVKCWARLNMFHIAHAIESKLKEKNT